MYCMHCGKEISNQSTYCSYCGKFVAEDSEGNKTDLNSTTSPKEDIILFTGRNSDYYQRKWSQMNKSGSSWNFAAFFFSIPWLGYRKMYGNVVLYSIIILLINVFINLLKEFNTSSLYSVIGIGVAASLGIVGNYLYKIYTEKKVRKINNLPIIPDKKIELIKRQGGTSSVGVVYAVLIFLAIYLLPVIIFMSGQEDVPPTPILEEKEEPKDIEEEEKEEPKDIEEEEKEEPKDIEEEEKEEPEDIEEEEKEEPEDIEGEEQPAAIQWNTYENERFGFIIQYPVDWVSNDSATNEDGSTLTTEKGDEVIVYGSHYLEDYESEAFNSGVTEDFKTNQGISSRVNRSEDGNHVIYQMSLIQNNIEYNISARITKEFEDEEEPLLYEIFKTFKVISQ